MKLTVGDRVRGKKGIGRIIYDAQDSQPYLVEHDMDFKYGHSGAGRGRHGRCWWYRPYEIELLDEPRFKVGDRVRGNGKRATTEYGDYMVTKLGYVGTVTKVLMRKGKEGNDIELDNCYEVSSKYFDPIEDESVGSSLVTPNKNQDLIDYLLNHPNEKISVMTGWRFPHPIEVTNNPTQGFCKDYMYIVSNDFPSAHFTGVTDIEPNPLIISEWTKGSAPKKESYMSQAVNFIKNQALKATNPDEYELRQAGLHNDCGELTAEGEALHQEFLRELTKEKMVATAKELNAEKKSKKE